jgi:uncharacterized membrane-anchored protein
MTDGRGRSMLTKVPEVTVVFWVTKLLTTAMGESTSDFLVKEIDPVVAVAFGGLLLIGALAVQLTADRYIPWKYWLAVVLVAVTGTMAADVLHIQFHVPYTASTALFAVVLAVVFVWWHRSEGTLSIHSIVTVRRELFYWATVMATFAMGTALGDLTATTLHLGYLTSAVVFAVLICLPAVGYFVFRLNAVAMFWTAYVLTRPLGASLADWAGKPHSAGGLDLGDGPVAVTLTALIIGMVAWMTVSADRTAARRPTRP